MTTIEPILPIVVDEPADAAAAGLLARLDAQAHRLGERLNPLLVKECRQALKGKQFSFTFGLLLAASWLWSITGIAMIGPEAYYNSVGTTMLYGYFLILAFPLIIVVPYGTFRSLAGECEDHTFELVSITTLRPRQVISGKLGSAVMQMLVYLSAVSPCLAFTYLLRGIDIISLTLILVYLVLGSLALSMGALLLATVARERHLQVALSILLILGLGFLFLMACGLASELVFTNFIPADQSDFWLTHAAGLTAYVSYMALFYLAGAAQITFASDNRSTAPRVVMLAQQLLFVGWMAWLLRHAEGWAIRNDYAPFTEIVLLLLGIHWYVMGVFLVGESPELSRRVKRSLPQSFLGRVFLTWFNPGPGTGYLFAISNLLGAVLLAGGWLLWCSQSVMTTANSAFVSMSSVPGPGEVYCFAVLGFSYITIYLGLGKLILAWLRRYTQVGLLLTVAIPVLLLLIGVGPPLTIYGMTAQRGGGYTLLQITNPFWTLWEVGDNATMPNDILVLLVIVPGVALGVFLMNLPEVVREMRHVRIAQPARVTEDEAHV